MGAKANMYRLLAKADAAQAKREKREPRTHERSPAAKHSNTERHVEVVKHQFTQHMKWGPDPKKAAMAAFTGQGYRVGGEEADLEAALAASLADEAAPSEKEVFTRFVLKEGGYPKLADEIWVQVGGNPDAAVEKYVELTARSHSATEQRDETQEKKLVALLLQYNLEIYGVPG